MESPPRYPANSTPLRQGRGQTIGRPQIQPRSPYNGRLGAKPPSGVKGQNPSAGGPEAETLLAFGRSMEATNLPTFPKIFNAKSQIQFVVFAKNEV